MESAIDRRDGTISVVVRRYCPTCGLALIPEGGCFHCRACGYSVCD